MATVKQYVGGNKSVKQTIQGSNNIKQDLEKEGYTESVITDGDNIDLSASNGGVTSDLVAKAQWGSITGNINNQSDLSHLLDSSLPEVLTTQKFNESKKYDRKMYIVTRQDGTVYRIYIGKLLLAQLGEKGFLGLPFTFPLTF